MSGKYYFLFAIYMFCLISCNMGKNEVKLASPDFTFHTSFYSTDGTEMTSYYQDHDNFIQDFLIAQQTKDTLHIETLFAVNACGNAIGQVFLENDTIYLDRKETSGILCASTRFDTYDFKIHNPSRKKYIIKSGK